MKPDRNTADNADLTREWPAGDTGPAPSDASGQETYISKGRSAGANSLPIENEQAGESIVRRLGRFGLIERLGDGQTGEFWRAVHLKLQKPVAIKLLDPKRMSKEKTAARFHQEIRLVSRLSHPNLVRLENVGQADGEHYLAMEWIDGINFEQLSRDIGPLPIAEACQLVGQAAVGLEHARRQGLTHGDIKPTNLMVTRSGVVKILGLGLAWMNESDGEASTDTAADIAALGRTLLGLLAELPIEATSELDAIVARMIAEDPHDRPKTPGEAAAALAPLATGCDISSLLEKVWGQTIHPGDTCTAEHLLSALDDPAKATSQTGRVTRFKKTRRRFVLPLVIVTFLLLGALGGLALPLWWYGKPTRQSAPKPPTTKTGLPPAPLVALDWDKVAWPSIKVLSRTFSLEDVDVTVSFTGDLPFSPGPASPNDAATHQGGLKTIEYSLFLEADPTAPSQKLTAKIEFSAPVRGVSFRLFDLDHDRGQPPERVRIWGTRNGREVKPQLTAGSANRIDSAGVVTGAAPADETGTQSGAGNVAVAFARTIDQIHIVLQPAPDEKQAKTINQFVGRASISLHDIQFTLDKPFAIAQTLDWDQVDWSRNHRHHTFSIHGVDVAIALSGDLLVSHRAWLHLDDFASHETDFHHGLVWGAPLRYKHEASAMTIDFSGAVQHVQFDLLNIDASHQSFAESVTIHGSFGGRVVQPTVESSQHRRRVQFQRPIDRIRFVRRSPTSKQTSSIALGAIRFRPMTELLHDLPSRPTVDSFLVPATANLWLAGRPWGEMDGGDIVPSESPVVIDDLPLQAGGAISFAVAGEVREETGFLQRDADGGKDVTRPVSQGLPAVTAPAGALLGVFVNRAQEGVSPILTLSSAPFLGPTESETLAPSLGQLFFIGDGQTTSGATQRFVIPQGAKRLVLSVMDHADWRGNVGAFEVAITTEVAQDAALLLAAGDSTVQAIVDEGKPITLQAGQVHRMRVKPGIHQVAFRRDGLEDRTVIVGPGDERSVPVIPPAMDLLAMVDPQRDANAAHMRRDGEAIHFHAVENQRALLQLPLITPEEFDLEMTVERTGGRDSLGVGMNAGKGRFLVVFDYGSKNATASLTASASIKDKFLRLLNFQSKPKGITGIRHGMGGRVRLAALRQGWAFPAGEPVQVRIAVRRGGVRIERNGQLWIEIKDDLSPLAMYSGDEAHYPGCLFLHNHRSQFVIRRLELRPYSDPPRRLRLSLGSASLDRLAAERVLWKGGVVSLLHHSPSRRSLKNTHDSESRATVITRLEDLPPILHLHSIRPSRSRRLGLTDEDLDMIGQLTRLRELDLSGARITNAGLAHLANLTELERVRLSGAKIDDQGVAMLAPALQRANYLCLCGTQTTAKAIRHLADLSQLETLHLGFTKITDDDLPLLDNMKNLKQIRLKGTSVTPQGIERLRRRFPQIQVVK